MKYIIKKRKYENVSFEINNCDGFILKPKLKTFEVKKITLFNYEFICDSINKSFLNRYKKLLKLTLSIVNDDDSDDTDVALLLGETEKLESIILNKYKKHIRIEKIKKMLKEVLLLEQQLKKKQELINVYQSTSFKSR